MRGMGGSPRSAPASSLGGVCDAPCFFGTLAFGDTPMEIVRLFSWFAALWGVLWLACGVFCKFVVVPYLPASSKPHENHSMYVGQKLVAEIKSLFIACAANHLLYTLFIEETSREFELGGYPPGEPYGILVTAFEIADLVLCLAFGFFTTEHVVHHLIHIGVGTLCRVNHAPTLTALIVMAQETSGLPLNYFLLMRHRISHSHWSIHAAQIAFATTFAIWRLGLGTYGTYHFVRFSPAHLPPTFPTWHARALGTALVFGSVLQWYWGVTIFRMVTRTGSIKKKKEE